MRWHTERQGKQEQNVYVERLVTSRVPHRSVRLFEKPMPFQEIRMFSFAASHPYSLLITGVTAVLLCASLAMAIVGWTPGATGLPVGVAAIHK